MTTQELMQRFGLTDPNQLYGGSTGLLKTGRQDFYDQSGVSGAGYQTALADLAKKFSTPQQLSELDFSGLVPKNIGNTEDTIQGNLNRPEFQYLSQNPEFMSGMNDLNTKFGQLSNKLQVTPELLQGTQKHSQNPEGYIGQWIRDPSTVKYSPEFGAYLEPTGGNQDYGVDSYSPQGNFFAQTLSDPMFTLPLAYAGAVASGLGAAGAGAGEAAAPSVGASAAPSAGAFAPGTLDALAAGANYGGISAVPGSLATGGFNVGAAGFGGLDFLGAAGAGAGVGALSDMPIGGNYGLASPDMFGAPNSIFPASSSTNPGLLSQIGVGEASNMSLAPWADALAGGANAGQLSPWIQAAQAGASSPSWFDSLKNAYDKYGKPVSQANSAMNALGGGGGSGPMVQTQGQENIPYVEPSQNPGGLLGNPQNGGYNQGNEKYVGIRHQQSQLNDPYQQGLMAELGKKRNQKFGLLGG